MIVIFKSLEEVTGRSERPYAPKRPDFKKRSTEGSLPAFNCALLTIFSIFLSTVSQPIAFGETMQDVLERKSIELEQNYPSYKLLVEWSTTIKLYPRAVQGYYQRGLVYLRLADEETREFKERDKKVRAAQGGGGAIFLSHGYQSLAVNDFTESMRLGNKSADLYYARGIALSSDISRIDHVDLAIDDFSQAINQRPNFASAYLRRGYEKIEQVNRIKGLCSLGRKRCYEPAYKDFDIAHTLGAY